MLLIHKAAKLISVKKKKQNALLGSKIICASSYTWDGAKACSPFFLLANLGVSLAFALRSMQACSWCTDWSAEVNSALPSSFCTRVPKCHGGKQITNKFRILELERASRPMSPLLGVSTRRRTEWSLCSPNSWRVSQFHLPSIAHHLLLVSCQGFNGSNLLRASPSTPSFPASFKWALSIHLPAHFTLRFVPQ